MAFAFAPIAPHLTTQPSMQTNRNQRSIVDLLPAGLLVFGVLAITLYQSGYFRMLPGGLGDPIFNNAVLEHLYRWVIGADKSLWSPGYFFPYPGALAFSDNHFGTGIVYVLMRLMGTGPEVAYIGWYTLAPILNYLACYGVLRRVGLARGGSAVGAFIFAFTFLASAQLAHAQLGYRFAVPLAMLAFERFMHGGGARELSKLAIFITLQFYCSIYLGYFLLLLLAALLVADYACRAIDRDGNSRPFHRAIVDALRAIVTGRAIVPAICILACLILLVVMFYPYIYYGKIYDFQRGLDEIRSMLPRPSSYLLSDNSWVWGRVSKLVSDVPMRWEHQMFFGISAIVLALIGFFTEPRQQNLRWVLSLLVLVVLTIQIGGHSIYVLLAQLPLANAIRAVSRIGLVMLFPLAILAGRGFDRLTVPGEKPSTSKVLLGAALALLMMAEYSAYAVERISLKTLDEHMAALKSQLPLNLQRNAILYVPFSYLNPLFMTELDGMRLAQSVNRPTINGYSGNVPSGYYDPAINACDVVNHRLSGYAAFARLSKAQFDDLVARVVMVGEPAHCRPIAELPEHTHMSGKLPDSVAKALTVGIGKIVAVQGQLVAQLSVANHSSEAVSSISDDGRPIRFSWRFVDVGSLPQLDEGWNSRVNLGADVAPGGRYQTQAVVAAPPTAGRYRLQLTLVQEKTAWLQDLGMPIADSSQVVVVKLDGTADIVDP